MQITVCENPTHLSYKAGIAHLRVHRRARLCLTRRIVKQLFFTHAATN
jgi:hypothetical protein